MVELNVDLQNKEALDADCFVAVRVGETQKLSRLAETRNYKFPQAGGKHYGKIEVYRRVGACGIDVDPMNDGIRNVSIGCGDFGKLQFNIQVGNLGGKASPTAAQEKSQETDKADKAGKSKAAKDYLRKHSVEMQLTEAMQALLRAKPENPIEFLANKLLGNVDGAVGVVKQAAAAPAPAAAPAAPAPQAYAAPVPAAAPAASVPPPPPAVLPFGDYFQKHFTSVKPSAFTKLYSKFDPVKRVEQAAPSDKAADARKDFAKKPSVGTWLALKPPTAAPAPTPAAPEKKKFNMKPSVGTWYGKVVKPTVAATSAPAASSAPPYPLPQKKKKMVVSTGSFGPQFHVLRLRPNIMVM